MEEKSKGLTTLEDVTRKGKRIIHNNNITIDSNSDSDSVKIFSFLPDYLFYEVLVRIPPENILKFMNIEKWSKTISTDLTFINRVLRPIRENYLGIITFNGGSFYYMKQSSSSSCLELIPTNDIEMTYFSIKFTLNDLLSRIHNHHPLKSPIILPSVNGLICIMDFISKSAYICNPTTLDFKILPNCHGHHLRRKVGYGFGYSLSPPLLLPPSSSSSSSSYKTGLVYKVVLVSSSSCLCCKSEDPDWIECGILTLGTKTWRKIKSPRYPLLNDAVFIDGVLYWVVMTRFHANAIIVSFNIEREEFVELTYPLPTHFSLEYEKEGKIVQLVDLNGSLGFIIWIISEVDYELFGAIVLEIWRMVKVETNEVSETTKGDSTTTSGTTSTDYGYYWVQDYSIDIKDFFKEINGIELFNTPFCLLSSAVQLLKIENGKILFKFNDEEKSTEMGIYSYDIENNKYEKVGLGNKYIQATIYEHSLVPLP